MSKLSIFSVLLVGSLLVSPIVAANNYTATKTAKASEISFSNATSSLLSFPSSSNLSVSSISNIVSTSIVDLQSSSLSEIASSTTKKVKIITDVKPVKLNVQGANWWKDEAALTGGNSDDSGIDAINTQIQSKLQTQCPNIYDVVAKTINETNLASCAIINNLPLQKIAIIDSGVTPNAEMTPFIDQVDSWNFFTSTNYPQKCTATSPIRFYTLVQGNSTIYYCKEKGTQSDTDYHGTTVAYTAIQTYKKSLLKNRVQIVPFSLRTLDTINISEAIDEVVRAGDIKSINLSVGTPYNLPYVETSVNDANTPTAGISVYASSGNCAVYSPANCDYNGNTVQDLPEEANNAPQYPASYLNAVMVGSSNYSDNSIAGIIRATYSNFAKVIRNNFVTAPVGNSGIILPCFTNCNGVTSYGYLGTSFASPQAAGLDGLVAKYSELMKLNLNQPNEKVLVATDTAKQYITNNTTDILAAGNDLESGTGLINLKKISDKIVTQLQTLNVSTSSSSVIPASSLLSSSSNMQSLTSSSTMSSMVAKNTMINSIVLSSDNLSYIVTSTSNFTPAFGSDHIHFYYNTEANTVTNKMFSNTGPYIIPVNTKPANATQLCTIVGTASHGIYPNTGNCVDLPIIQQVASSSVLLSSSTLSSSNVISSSSNQAVPSSSTQAAPASSSQVSSASKTNSSSSTQNSTTVSSSSTQTSSSAIKQYSSIVTINNSAISIVSSSASGATNSNNSGGGIISIISGIISNVINTITGASANVNGNTSLITPTSLASLSSVALSSQNVKSQDFAIKENGVKLSEDVAFSGLVNNPNGLTVEQQAAIENKNQVDSNKDNLDLKKLPSRTYTGGRKNEDNSIANNINSTTSSVTLEETCKKGYEYYKACSDMNACRKGWDGSIKGGLVSVNEQSNSQPAEGKLKGKIITPGDNGMRVSDQIISDCKDLSLESCKKGITENGLKLTDNEAIDCSSNSECRKGWDGSIKGSNICDQSCDSTIGGITGGAVAGKVIEKSTSGLKDTLKTQVKMANPSSQTGCMNPNPTIPQSDISSSNDISKYIPILVLAIVGVAGAIAVSSLTVKQKSWLKDTRLSSQISNLRKMSNNKHPDLMKVMQETQTDSLKTKPTESVSKKEYVGHVTLNK